MRASVIIPTYKRDHLLNNTLISIMSQDTTDIEVLVLDDGDGQGKTKTIAEYHGVEYVWTGQHKKKNQWRVPGFANNIGAKLALGEVLIINDAEVWHLGDCLKPMIEAVEKDNMALAIPEGKDANKYIECYEEMKPLNTELPFLMALERKIFLSIGGYDEDYVGYDCDDRDLVQRLLWLGCHHVNVNAKCIHQYHPRYTTEHTSVGSNRELFKKKTQERSIYRNGIQAPLATG